MLLGALKKRYLIWQYEPASDSSAAGDDRSTAVSYASGSMATTSDGSSSMTSTDNVVDEEDDVYFTPPPGSLAAPNLLHRALAILLSSETHVDPAVLPALINADTNSAVPQWDESKSKIQDLQGRKAARAALRQADEAAEMMLACSDRVSRKVRDAARRRILMKRERKAEKHRDEMGLSHTSALKNSSSGATSGLLPHVKAQEASDHERTRRCNLLFVPLCLFCMDCGILEVYITASKASCYAVDIVSTGLPLVAKLLYGISLSHDKAKLTR